MLSASSGCRPVPPFAANTLVFEYLANQLLGHKQEVAAQLSTNHPCLHVCLPAWCPFARAYSQEPSVVVVSSSTQLVSPAWNQTRPWLVGSWVMQRPPAFMQEAGGRAGQEQLPAQMDLVAADIQTAEGALVDDLLSVMMGQVGQQGLLLRGRVAFLCRWPEKQTDTQGMVCDPPGMCLLLETVGSRITSQISVFEVRFPYVLCAGLCCVWGAGWSVHQDEAGGGLGLPPTGLLGAGSTHRRPAGAGRQGGVGPAAAAAAAKQAGSAWQQWAWQQWARQQQPGSSVWYPCTKAACICCH